MDTATADSDTLPRLEIAAEYATTNVPEVSPGVKIRDVWPLLRGTRYDSVDELAVCRGPRLLGLVRMEDVFAADDDEVVDAIMDVAPPTVAPGTDQELAAKRAVDHGESSLAVIDEDGRFCGLIPPLRLLGVLLEEHHEDLARLGGYLRSTREARQAGHEPVAQRFLHRIPWLIVGLAGAVIAALLLGRFEERLQTNVLLAFFVPGIVYLADAVGTQTETVVIRGLSVGISVREILAREVLTGVLVGGVIAATFFPVSLLIWRNLDVGIAVTLALLAACSTATLVALALPAILNRFGTDPAFGSGPLATVVQDLLSLAIYLAIVVVVVD